MLLPYLLNLGMFGSGGAPPLALRRLDPSQTTLLPRTGDVFAIDPDRTIMLAAPSDAFAIDPEQTTLIT